MGESSISSPALSRAKDGVETCGLDPSPLKIITNDE